MIFWQFQVVIMTQYDKFITTPHREHSLLMKYFYLLIFPFYFVINLGSLTFFGEVDWTIRTMAQIAIELTRRTEGNWEDRGRQEDIYYWHDGLPGLNCTSENPN